MDDLKSQSFPVKKKPYHKPELVKYDDILTATKNGDDLGETEDDGGTWRPGTYVG